MNPIVYLYSYITKSQEKLPVDIQNRIRIFLKKFEKDPNHPSLNREKIHSSDFESARITDKYRAIFYHQKAMGKYFILHLGNHDETYRWAIRNKYQWNDRIQSGQVFTPFSSAQSGMEGLGHPVPSQGTIEVQREELLLIGVPEDWVDFIQDNLSKTCLDNIKYNLPELVLEKLHALLDGIPIREIIEEVAEGKNLAVEGEDSAESPNNRQSFFPYTDDMDLQLFFTGDMATWRYFLHPEQNRLVQGYFKGPIRITGGAGTGKTVAALHRLKYLMAKDAGDSGRCLFCTYTNALKENLERMANGMAINNPGKYDILTIHTLAVRLAKKLENKLPGSLPDATDKSTVAGDIRRRDLAIWQSILEGKPITPDFAQDEYEKVILFQQLTTIDDYLRALRTGREKKISEESRIAMWHAFEAFREEKRRKKGLLTFEELFYELTAYFSKLKEKPYAHIIVDELQDLGNQELRFLRSLVAPGKNDLFMVGDPFQRIFDRKIIFQQLRIEIRGSNSRYLRRNYRTTEEIRQDAVEVLGKEVLESSNTDGDNLQGYYSLGRGPRPLIREFERPDQEKEFILDSIRYFTEKEEISLEEICLATYKKELLKDYQNDLHKHFKVNVIMKSSAISTPGYLNISTLHNLKGLEFKAILLVGMNARQYKSVLNTPTVKEDEKRHRALLYVAMTRAKLWLYVSSSGAMDQALKGAIRQHP